MPYFQCKPVFGLQIYHSKRVVAKVVQAKELQRRKPRGLPWLSIPVIRPNLRIAIWVGISGRFLRSADGSYPGLGLVRPSGIDRVRVKLPLAVGPVWTVVRDRVLLARHSDADSILWRHEMIKAHSVLGNGELNPLDDPVELVPVCPVLR